MLWKERIPEGTRAWVCAVCNANCENEADAYCVRPRDRTARCGYAETYPESLHAALPFYVKHA